MISKNKIDNYAKEYVRKEMYDFNNQTYQGCDENVKKYQKIIDEKVLRIKTDEYLKQALNNLEKDNHIGTIYNLYKVKNLVNVEDYKFTNELNINILSNDIDEIINVVEFELLNKKNKEDLKEFISLLKI